MQDVKFKWVFGLTYTLSSDDGHRPKLDENSYKMIKLPCKQQ